MPLVSIFTNRIFRIVFITLIVVAGIIGYQIYKPVKNPVCKDCNVILISVDTLRADHMGVYGYKRNTTPNIDSWAKKSTVFTNASTILPLTFHSFLTLFTGNDDVLQKEEVSLSYANVDMDASTIKTLPDILKQNSYTTSAFVTNGIVGSINKIFSKGFDNFNYINLAFRMGYYSEYENSREVTNQAIRWLGNKSSDKFFLWVHYTNPHYPYKPPKEDLCKIDKECNKNNYDSLLRADVATDMKDGFIVGKVLKSCSNTTTQDGLNLAINLYDASIYSADHEVGKILQEIEKLNLKKNTIIIFYADHGEGFDHDMFGHGNIAYQETIKIPLIMSIPGINKFGQSNRLIQNQDIMPTILKLLNINQPDKFSGIEFSDIFIPSNQSQNKRKYSYSITPTNLTNRFTVSDGKYKYIYSKSNICLFNNQQEELYDISSDPNEKNNIISKNPTIAKIFKEQMDKYMNGLINLKSTNTKTDQDVINKLKSLGY